MIVYGIERDNSDLGEYESYIDKEDIGFYIDKERAINKMLETIKERNEQINLEYHGYKDKNVKATDKVIQRILQKYGCINTNHGSYFVYDINVIE